MIEVFDEKDVEDRIDNYPDRNISEYEDCLTIIDKLIGDEDASMLRNEEAA